MLKFKPKLPALERPQSAVCACHWENCLNSGSLDLNDSVFDMAVEMLQSTVASIILCSELAFVSTVRDLYRSINRLVVQYCLPVARMKYMAFAITADVLQV